LNKFLVDTVDSKDKLIQYFRKGIKKDNELRIGVEHEKFLFNKSDLKRVDYNQIKKVFENLKNNGWEPEYEKDRIIGLKRENQKITTEPGFQYELSGAPFKNIHLVCSENSSHFNELKEIFSSTSITTSSIAYDPFNKLTDIPKSPKERYTIMTSEMPKGGKLSLDMMYKTAGIQINYDYISEEDFEKKFKIGNYLAPLTIALFANSPFNENKLSGFLSYRGKVWQETNRGGIMPITFENVNFEKYIDHAINYPILFLKKNGKYYSPNGQTFRDFLNGNLIFLKGEKPTLEDFENHLSTIFTEIRLKQVIEFRSLDTCNFGCICNGPSFFTGLIYGSLEETYEIIKNWNPLLVMEAYLNAPKQGLNTLLKNKKLIDWAKIFLNLSKKGLEKRNELNKSGKNETIYLKHIEEIISNKKTRAEMLIEQYNKTKKLDFLINHDENFSYSGF
jgi:glutamate--cysteine ligase